MNLKKRASRSPAPRSATEAKRYYFVSYYFTLPNEEGAFSDCVMGIRTDGFHLAAAREYIKMIHKAKEASIIAWKEISRAEYELADKPDTLEN